MNNSFAGRGLKGFLPSIGLIPSAYHPINSHYFNVFLLSLSVTLGSALLRQPGNDLPCRGGRHTYRFPNFCLNLNSGNNPQSMDAVSRWTSLLLPAQPTCHYSIHRAVISIVSLHPPSNNTQRANTSKESLQTIPRNYIQPRHYIYRVITSNEQ